MGFVASCRGGANGSCCGRTFFFLVSVDVGDAKAFSFFFFLVRGDSVGLLVVVVVALPSRSSVRDLLGDVTTLAFAVIVPVDGRVGEEGGDTKEAAGGGSVCRIKLPLSSSSSRGSLTGMVFLARRNLRFFLSMRLR